MTQQLKFKLNKGGLSVRQFLILTLKAKVKGVRVCCNGNLNKKGGKVGAIVA